MKFERPRRIGLAAVLALAAVAVMASFAQGATPAPGYTQFAGCPSPAENPAVELCVRSVVKGGHVKLGSKEVPIVNPITLSGGTNFNLEHFVANSKGGLTPVKEKVPGGVVGLTGLTWLLEVLGSEALTLYAVTELAGTPEMNLNNITLPIKVHLVNPTLGNNCYIGSNSNPIVMHLTDGTTKPPAGVTPLTGVFPTLSFDEEKGILHATNGTYVDNTFAVPGASGCVLTLFGVIPISINGLVNQQSGVPAAPGVSEAVQNIDTELTSREFAYP
jgi:hypothetical protein